MKSRNYSDSFKYALDGILHTVKTERNFRFHLILAALAVAACVVLQVEAAQFLHVVSAIFLVLCMELVNTAVEAAVDLFCGKTKHPLAKTAKDVSAAAVLLSAVNALVVAGTVAWSVVSRWLG